MIELRMRRSIGAFAFVMLMTATVGAETTPWTRLETDTASSHEGTKVLTEGPYADEASGRCCTELLRQGAWLEWEVERSANAVVLRYSVPDTPDGAGLDVPLEVLVNDRFATTLTLTSRLSHLYGTEHQESSDPAEGNHRRFYDEIRFRMSVNEGDRLRLRLPESPPPGDQPVIVDFAELEPIPEPIARPSDAMDLVRDFGAVPDDDQDDLEPLVRALAECARRRCVLYVPPGVYRLSDRIDLPSGVTIQGAGMWWTELHFTAEPIGKSGGFYPAADATDIVLRDFYMRGRASIRGMGGQPMNGGFGKNSRVEHVWWEHLNNARFINSEGLRIVGCRARNNLAGGIILFGGSIGAVIENCHVRYASDDGIGSFASGYAEGRTPPNRDNVIRNNLVELTGRAGGIGVFGGSRIHVRDNVILDTLPSAQADLRFTTTFDQYLFGEEGPVVASGNVMRGFRGKMGSILFLARYLPTSNIVVRDNRIEKADGPAICFRGMKPEPAERVTIEDLTIECDPRSAAPAITVEREFQGHVQMKNVDVDATGPVGRVESTNDGLTLEFNSACDGWAR